MPPRKNKLKRLSGAQQRRRRKARDTLIQAMQTEINNVNFENPELDQDYFDTPRSPNDLEIEEERYFRELGRSRSPYEPEFNFESRDRRYRHFNRQFPSDSSRSPKNHEFEEERYSREFECPRSPYQPEFNRASPGFEPRVRIDCRNDLNRDQNRRNRDFVRSRSPHDRFERSRAPQSRNRSDRDGSERSRSSQDQKRLFCSSGRRNRGQRERCTSPYDRRTTYNQSFGTSEHSYENREFSEQSRTPTGLSPYLEHNQPYEGQNSRNRGSQEFFEDRRSPDDPRTLDRNPRFMRPSPGVEMDHFGHPMSPDDGSHEPPEHWVNHRELSEQYRAPLRKEMDDFGGPISPDRVLHTASRGATERWLDRRELSERSRSPYDSRSHRASLGTEIESLEHPRFPNEELHGALKYWVDRREEMEHLEHPRSPNPGLHRAPERWAERREEIDHLESPNQGRSRSPTRSIRLPLGREMDHFEYQRSPERGLHRAPEHWLDNKERFERSRSPYEGRHSFNYKNRDSEVIERRNRVGRSRSPYDQRGPKSHPMNLNKLDQPQFENKQRDFSPKSRTRYDRPFEQITLPTTERSISPRYGERKSRSPRKHSNSRENDNFESNDPHLDNDSQIVRRRSTDRQKLNFMPKADIPHFESHSQNFDDSPPSELYESYCSHGYNSRSPSPSKNPISPKTPEALKGTQVSVFKQELTSPLLPRAPKIELKTPSTEKKSVPTENQHLLSSTDKGISEIPKKETETNAQNRPDDRNLLQQNLVKRDLLRASASPKKLGENVQLLEARQKLNLIKSVGRGAPKNVPFANFDTRLNFLSVLEPSGSQLGVGLSKESTVAEMSSGIQKTSSVGTEDRNLGNNLKRNRYQKNPAQILIAAQNNFPRKDKAQRVYENFIKSINNPIKKIQNRIHNIPSDPSQKSLDMLGGSIGPQKHPQPSNLGQNQNSETWSHKSYFTKPENHNYEASLPPRDSGDLNTPNFGILAPPSSLNEPKTSNFGASESSKNLSEPGTLNFGHNAARINPSSSFGGKLLPGDFSEPNNSNFGASLASRGHNEPKTSTFRASESATNLNESCTSNFGRNATRMNPSSNFGGKLPSGSFGEPNNSNFGAPLTFNEAKTLNFGSSEPSTADFELCAPNSKGFECKFEDEGSVGKRLSGGAKRRKKRKEENSEIKRLLATEFFERTGVEKDYFEKSVKNPYDIGEPKIGFGVLEMEKYLIVPIVWDSFPHKRINNIQTEIIKEYLNSKLADLVAKPKFESIVLSNGVIYILCYDLNGKMWLERIFENIPKICDTFLRVVDLNDINMVKVQTRVKSFGIAPKQFLELLHKSNPDISIKKWKIINEEQLSPKKFRYIIRMSISCWIEIVERKKKLDYIKEKIVFEILCKNKTQRARVDKIVKKYLQGPKQHTEPSMRNFGGIPQITRSKFQNNPNFEPMESNKIAANYTMVPSGTNFGENPSSTSLKTQQNLRFLDPKAVESNLAAGNCTVAPSTTNFGRIPSSARNQQNSKFFEPNVVELNRGAGDCTLVPSGTNFWGISSCTRLKNQQNPRFFDPKAMELNREAGDCTVVPSRTNFGGFPSRTSLKNQHNSRFSDPKSAGLGQNASDWNRNENSKAYNFDQNSIDDVVVIYEDLSDGGNQI